MKNGGHVNPVRLSFVQNQLEELSDAFTVAGTDLNVLLDASLLAVRRNLQFWDAVLWMAAQRGGADHILSEDLQDGLHVDGMRILNPFNPDNRAEIDALLA